MPCADVHSTPRPLRSPRVASDEPTGVHAGPQPAAGDLRGPVLGQCLQPRMQVCTQLLGSGLEMPACQQRDHRTADRAGQRVYHRTSIRARQAAALRAPRAARRQQKPAGFLRPALLPKVYRSAWTFVVQRQQLSSVSQPDWISSAIRNVPASSQAARTAPGNPGVAPARQPRPARSISTAAVRERHRGA